MGHTFADLEQFVDKDRSKNLTKTTLSYESIVPKNYKYICSVLCLQFSVLNIIGLSQKMMLQVFPICFDYLK